MEGADDKDALANAAVFFASGMMNTRNLDAAYKVEAFRGAREALKDRMVKAGASEEQAYATADRYSRWAIERGGGWDKLGIKDFDVFSRAMKKGWHPDVEARADVEPGAPAGPAGFSEPP
ncbi:MAG: hypothetical protein OHK006_25080 [Thermodesulfovibrionales bacterium]